MRRSIKDSDEEVDMKSGRKTRVQTEVVSVDSPLRRSSRIKPNIKQYESSPESSLSDVSNISNIQTAKSKKQRTSVMDSSTPTENQRTLRSRMNSVSSDISEVPETDVGTPTKKTKNNPSNSNKTNSRRSKRLTRAGSEVNSPPPATRVTRSTRASSVEPESNISNKLLEKYQNEFVSSPIKTRRRTSVLPSEAMIIEEKGQYMKIPMVTLDRTLPDLNEVKEPDNSPKTAQKNEKQHKLDTSHSNVNEKHAEDDVSVKGPHDNPPKNLSSNSFEDVEKGTSTDDKKISDIDKDVPESIETSSTNTVKQIESSVDNDPQIPSQNESQNTAEEIELKLEDLNKSVTKQSHINDENLTTNIDIDSQRIKKTISDTLESPKHLSISSLNANESTKEEHKSLCVETNGTLKRHSEELLGVPNDNVSIQVNSDTNVVNNLSVENLDASVNEDNSDNIPKLVMNAETDSVNDNSFEENSDKGAIIEVSTNSSLNDSIAIMEHTEDGKTLVDDESTEINIKISEESSEINIKECNENSKLNDSNDSNAKESINENEESKKDNKDQNIITSDQCDKKDRSGEPSASENMHKNDDTNCTKMLSPKLNNTESESGDMKLIGDTQHSIVSEHEDISCLQDTNKTDNLACNSISPSKSSDTCISHGDSALTNMNEANVTNVIKNHNSSIVAETPAECVKGEPERGEQSKKVSILDDSLTLKKQCAHRLESNEKQPNINQAASKECQEHMKVDENDSDTNMTNLFQDILATEWKEKNNEKLQNESEGECDLVLVDKEAWLTVENFKKEKEKENFDYDSDDTVVLKVQRDSIKAQNEDLLMDVSEDESNLNEGKDKSSSTNEQKTIKQNKNKGKKEMIEDSKDTIQNVAMSTNADENKSVTKRNNRHSISKSNVSIQKSKDLSESCEVVEVEENLSLNKSKLSKDGPKRRKSLNKSIREVDNKLEEPNGTETIKKKKSLNKSNSKENEEVNEMKSCNKDVVTSVKKTEKSQSLNNSLKKKIKPQQLDVNFATESDNESNEFESCEKDTVTKKKLNRNYSTVANIGSDSNESKSISDSDDSQNKFMELPKFLFDGASDSSSDDDNESNNTIDSDIQKEYNLHGKDISKFSDDDVPGDECRASETESSDPDDNGSDLADFVVDDDEVEGEEESNESDGEEGEEMENDELEKDDAKEDQRDNEEEMQSETKIKHEINQKEEQYENNNKNTNEKDINKLTDTSTKEKNKSKSANVSLSHTIGSDKKKNKKLKTDQTEISEKENNFTDLSFSSPTEIKKTKQKRASGEFIVEGVEESINESQLVFNKKMQKLNKSMECSTPKINVSKQEKFNVTICDIHKNDSLNDEENKNITLQEEHSLKKLSNIKCNETLMHRSLPSELIDLLTKTNLSKPMLTKVSELNKTAFVSGSETPTTKYLKKEKLNESAPILKLDTNSKKSPSINNNNDQIEPNEDDNEQKTEILQDVNDSLKRKLFKVADNILENDRQKKRKKQKQSAVKETISSKLCENNDSEIVEKTKHVIFNVNTDNNDEKVDKKKRKKKKMKTDEADIQMQKETTEIKSESRNKMKKKKKEEILVEDIPVVENINEKKVIKKKKKKVSDFLPSDNISNEQILQKKRKLLVKDTALQDNEALSEQIPIVAKKKKRPLSNDTLQNKEVLIKKVPKKKHKLSKDITDQGENISVEKSRKKQKLLVGVQKDNVKHISSYNKPQEFNDALSDSDEGPETVTFSKAREEALEVLKRTADSIKANKDIQKKKQKEHIEKMQKQKQIKTKKLRSNNQITESNKVEKQETCVKRLPDDVIQNLSDTPLKSLQKKKSEIKEQVLPSLMSKPKKMKNIFVEDDFTLPSCTGSTTEFSVVDIQKIKKKQKVSKVTSFRQKMLNRNSRQPMSAYLIYLEKQRALGKDKFCNKPY